MEIYRNKMQHARILHKSFHRFIFAALVAGFAMLGGPGAVQAQTVRRVPLDYPTIQGAIDDAVDGDIVLVAPGAYQENINFLGKAITVESEQGPGATILDGSQADSVVTFASGEGLTSVLSGFTVQNGRSGFDTPGFGDGGGIRIEFSSPIVQDNIITNNFACNGVGINVRFGSPLIQANIISNNVRAGCSGGLGGGGIGLGFSTSAQIIGNSILNNSGGVRGGGISLNGAKSTIIRNNVIRGNTARDGGGMAMINDISGSKFIQNLITDNSGHAVYWISPPDVLVNNTIVAATGAGIYGWGFQVRPTLVNNIVVGQGPGAIECRSFSSTSPPIFKSNNVFSPSGSAFGVNCIDQTGINGNISVNPLFVDPSSDDFHLQATSLSIDSGDNTAPELPPTDFEGHSRILDGDADGIATVDMGVYEFSQVQQVTIDIKPGSDLNCFNSNGHGVIPVAILGSDTFDASIVDPLTVALDGADARVKGTSGKAGSLEDVNGDEFLDLVVQIADEGEYSVGDTSATLTGETYDGIPILGSDAICIRPPE